MVFQRIRIDEVNNSNLYDEKQAFLPEKVDFITTTVEEKFQAIDLTDKSEPEIESESTLSNPGKTYLPSELKYAPLLSDSEQESSLSDTEQESSLSDTELESSLLSSEDELLSSDSENGSVSSSDQYEEFIYKNRSFPPPLPLILDEYLEARKNTLDLLLKASGHSHGMLDSLHKYWGYLN